MTRQGATRTCIGCKEARQQADLVRYVLTPELEVIPDLKGKLPGRGCYTCISVDCIEKAVERKQFHRAFKGRNAPVEKSALVASVIQSQRDRVLNLIGMTRKAGLVVTGSSLVLTGMPKGAFDLVLQAEDMAGGTGRKIVDAARKNDIDLVVFLDRDQLGRAVGKDWRSVLGFKPGGLTEALQQELYRYKELVGE